MFLSYEFLTFLTYGMKCYLQCRKTVFNLLEPVHQKNIYFQIDLKIYKTMAKNMLKYISKYIYIHIFYTNIYFGHFLLLYILLKIMVRKQ